MPFTAAIVGRPNVGKSTLFNRLTGKRHAIVDDRPGVTRDRRMGDAHLAGLAFQLIDTAGLEDAESGTLQARMTAQTTQAIDEADVTLLVIDGRAGVTPLDRHFAALIRKKHKPIILLVNKAEGGKASATLSEAFSLGFGEPVSISAEHGEGLADLYEALAPFDCEPDAAHVDEANAVMQIAIIGRPNVGKSTLINHILGQDRVLTGPEAGITRDAITVEAQFEGKTLKLVDTAGMRRKANVVDKLEKLAVADSLHAIQYAHVVVLMIDANEPLEKQEAALAALVEQEGRALVLAVNKWETVKDQPALLKTLEARLTLVLPQLRGLPIVPISAQTGMNVPKLLKTCFRVYGLWNKQLGTGELNRWLEAALETHTPPMVELRRIKIRYMTQKTARPPTFLLFSNISAVPEHYLRYLSNSLREHFALPGIPIRIKVRKNKNPYAAS